MKKSKQVYCQGHKDKGLTPLMIPFHKNSLGQEYTCAVCSGTRVFNQSIIQHLPDDKHFGFIKGKKNDIFFHFNDLACNFRPSKGMRVSYEVVFLDDNANRKIQAINVQPI